MTAHSTSETLFDTWGDSLKIEPRDSDPALVNLWTYQNGSAHAGYLAGIDVADLRAALDRLYPPDEAPAAVNAPHVDLDTASRFARALKAAGHDHDHYSVPIGVLRDAIKAAFGPARPEGAAELESALEAVKGDIALAHLPRTQIARLADAVAAHQGAQNA